MQLSALAHMTITGWQSRENERHFNGNWMPEWFACACDISNCAFTLCMICSEEVTEVTQGQKVIKCICVIICVRGHTVILLWHNTTRMLPVLLFMNIEWHNDTVMDKSTQFVFAWQQSCVVGQLTAASICCPPVSQMQVRAFLASQQSCSS